MPCRLAKSGILCTKFQLIQPDNSLVHANLQCRHSDCHAERKKHCRLLQTCLPICSSHSLEYACRGQYNLGIIWLFYTTMIWKYRILSYLAASPFGGSRYVPFVKLSASHCLGWGEEMFSKSILYDYWLTMRITLFGCCLVDKLLKVPQPTCRASVLEVWKLVANVIMCDHYWSGVGSAKQSSQFNLVRPTSATESTVQSASTVQ